MTNNSWSQSNLKYILLSTPKVDFPFDYIWVNLGTMGSKSFFQLKFLRFYEMIYALSFYRYQNVLCKSKFLSQSKTLIAFSSYSKSFVPAQKPNLLNGSNLFVFGLALKLWTIPKHFETCRRTLGSQEPGGNNNVLQRLFD